MVAELLPVNVQRALGDRLRQIPMPGIEVGVRQLEQRGGEFRLIGVRTRTQLHRRLEHGNRFRVCAALLENRADLRRRRCNQRVGRSQCGVGIGQRLARERDRLVEPRLIRRSEESAISVFTTSGEFAPSSDRLAFSDASSNVFA